MPWEIKHRGGKHLVVKKGTLEVVGTHATMAEAQAHMRALYANVIDVKRRKE